MPPTKRRYGETLTGGTGDVNPQTYVVSVELPVGDSATTVTGFPVPVPRYPGSNNRAIVMEVLEVEWILNGSVGPAAASGDNYSITAGLTTNGQPPQSSLDLAQDPKVFSSFRRKFTTLVSGTAANFFIFTPDQEEEDDLTDQAGHGVLIGTDTIYLVYSQQVTNYTYAGNLCARINYRMKEVGLQEYIGIVQSQQ